MLKNKYFKIILLIGIALRLVFALFAYHPDIVPLYFAGKVLKEGNVANFYDFMPNLPDTHDYLKVYPRNIFNYPPAVYFSLGGISILTTDLFNRAFLDNFLFDIVSILGTVQLYLLLLVLKLPFFAFDLGILYFIRNIFTKDHNKNLASVLWLFNPVNLYATYMMGQFDIIPTFFVAVVLYRLAKGQINSKNILVSAFLLGIGGAFKIFPLLFLVPLASSSKKWLIRILTVGIGSATYLLSIVPFINSSGFRSTALIASQTTKSLYAAIPISGGESIILYISLLLFLYILFLLNPHPSKNLWQYFMLTLLSFFALTHFHPQWLLWLTPFIILELTYTKFKNLLPALVMFFAYLFSLFFFDPGLTSRLFAPLVPSLYVAPGLVETLGLSLDYNFVRSILQSIFVGGLLYYFYIFAVPKLNKI